MWLVFPLALLLRAATVLRRSQMDPGSGYFGTTAFVQPPASSRDAKPLDTSASILETRRPLAQGARPPRCFRARRVRGTANVQTAAGAIGASAIGGARVQALLTAVVAGAAVFCLCALDQVTMRVFKVPLWAPPLGAAALIFAAEATAAATKGDILSGRTILDRAMNIFSGVAGSCALAVLVTEVVGATPFGRALSVVSASLFMAAFPFSAYFPPAGAFCVLFVDQSMAEGALGGLGWRYALFPGAAGTVVLFVGTRLLTSLLAQPLRRFAASRA